MPIYLIMASSSSSIDFSWVTWENVLEKTELVLDQTKCSLLKTYFPEVHVFFHLTEMIQLFNLKECFKFTEDEARQILEACDSVQVDAPEVKRRKVESDCPTPSTVGDPKFWKSPSCVVSAVSHHRHCASSTRRFNYTVYLSQRQNSSTPIAWPSRSLLNGCYF